MIQMSFFRDTEGKISATKLSPYGEQQLRLLQGSKLHFTDATLTVKGNALVDDSGKVVEKLNNDRIINKVIYKIM